MKINLQNIDQLFKDKKVRNLLPEFKHLFDSWTLSQQLPALRNLGKRSALDFLNALESKHLDILTEHFGQKITVDKLDYHIVRHIETTLEMLPLDIEGCEDFLDLAMYRNNDQVYISFWR